MTGTNMRSIRNTLPYWMMRYPRPTRPMKNSATIIPINPRPMDSLMPASMNGSDDGMITSVHSRRSLVLKARATSRRPRSTLRTPCCVLMSTGNTQKRATAATRGASPWNLKMNPMSGMSATEGTE